MVSKKHCQRSEARPSLSLQELKDVASDRPAMACSRVRECFADQQCTHIGYYPHTH